MLRNVSLYKGGLLAGKAYGLCADMYIQLLIKNEALLFSLDPEKVKRYFKKYFEEIELKPIPDEQNIYEVILKSKT